MKKMILIRSLPGAGKSYLAEKLKNNFESNDISCIVLTTDDFFVYNNKYNFDGSLLSVAHPWNLGRAIRSMMREIDVVIVPNTMTQWIEMENYVKNALKFSYTVEVKEPETEWKFNVEECAIRNSHGVSAEIIQKMMDRWELTESILEKIN
jgi:tRNA uridine 5-carbamoylmethylation protein Kti12